MFKGNAQMPGQSLLVDKGTHYEYNTQVREGQDKQVNISIEEGVLHFKATIEENSETGQSRQHYMRMVQRSETLPKDADPTTLKSEYKNGFLILTLEKIKSSAKTLKKGKEPVQESKKPHKEEKGEHNTTELSVPHTSSHV
jgi:HSP20 family molecular chaperone IbpA